MPRQSEKRKGRKHISVPKLVSLNTHTSVKSSAWVKDFLSSWCSSTACLACSRFWVPSSKQKRKRTKGRRRESRDEWEGEGKGSLLSMVVHACDPNTWEAEAWGLWIWDQPRLLEKTFKTKMDFLVYVMSRTECLWSLKKLTRNSNPGQGDGIKRWGLWDQRKVRRAPPLEEG